jgi:hypothetical protein
MTARIVVAVAAVSLLAAAPGHGIVPPKDCGTLKVHGKTYNIKADQLPCSQARKYASKYIAHGTRPRGYGCHRFKGSALVAKCVNTHTNPDRTIFIIKR